MLAEEASSEEKNMVVGIAVRVGVIVGAGRKK